MAVSIAIASRVAGSARTWTFVASGPTARLMCSTPRSCHTPGLGATGLHRWDHDSTGPMGHGQSGVSGRTLGFHAVECAHFVNRTIVGGLSALLLAVAVTVGLDPLPVVAASCAPENPSFATQVCGGAIAPGSSGTTSTNFTFSVTYRNSNNKPAAYMRVVISGAGGTHLMTAGGTTWTTGVTFTYTTKLPAGSYTYYYVGTRTGAGAPARYDPEQPATYALTVTA